MKRMVCKRVILTVGSCLIAMLIAGCEEQNLSTARRDKLVAYENKQLEEQLAQQEKEIEEQNRLLEECQQRREILEKRFEEEVNANIIEAMEIFGQADKELYQESNQLKAQVKELQAEVSKLKQELKDIKSPEAPKPLIP